jgi:hypothetical protein
MAIMAWKEGTASVARMATTVIATISSISVKPPRLRRGLCFLILAERGDATIGGHQQLDGDLAPVLVMDSGVQLVSLTWSPMAVAVTAKVGGVAPAGADVVTV